MNLRRKWGHYSALTRAEARLFLRACWMLVLVDLELRLRPWQRCPQQLAAWAAISRPAPAGGASRGTRMFTGLTTLHARCR
jgi:hypothetical protein